MWPVLRKVRSHDPFESEEEKNRWLEMLKKSDVIKEIAELTGFDYYQLVEGKQVSKVKNQAWASPRKKTKLQPLNACQIQEFEQFLRRIKASLRPVGQGTQS